VKVTVCEMDDDEGRFANDWEGLVKHAKEAASELILLPEMPFYGWFPVSPRFDAGTWNEAVAAHQRWMKRLTELAPAAVVGTRPINRKGRRFNEGFVWRKERGARGVHVKGHLPDEEGYYEASWYHRGDRRFSAFRIPPCKVGMMICSDLWSMSHAREFGKKGVHLISVPFAASMSNMEKWMAGGKVAAVISGAFCIASNRVGEREGVRFGGSGWIIGPDAEVLGQTSREEPFVTADIDPQVAEAAKKTHPRDALQPD
jgi:N-carbamoylputrescine amidase